MERHSAGDGYNYPRRTNDELSAKGIYYSKAFGAKPVTKIFLAPSVDMG
jgi:hypothetical protein